MDSIAKKDDFLHEASKLGKLDKKLEDFAKRKKRSKEMANYIYARGNVFEDKLSNDLRSCANYLVFNHYYKVDQVRLSKIYTCKKTLLCPFCAAAKGIKSSLKYFERVQQLLKEQPLIPALLTITVKNGDNLLERTNHLRKSFKTLLSGRKQSRYGKNSTYNSLSAISGGVYSIETTYSQNTGWHPHLHALVLLDGYIDQELLAKEWKEITGDSFIVGITKIKGNSETELMNGIMEVFKYSFKFSDMPLSVNYKAYHALSGQRLQSAFGSLWGVKIPKELTDELLENEPFIELIYQYFDNYGYVNNSSEMKKIG